MFQTDSKVFKCVFTQYCSFSLYLYNVRFKMLLSLLMNVFPGGSGRRRLLQRGQDERHLCEGMAQGEHSLSLSSPSPSLSPGTRGLPGNRRPLSVAHRGRKLQLEVWFDFNLNLTTYLLESGLSSPLTTWQPRRRL